MLYTLHVTGTCSLIECQLPLSHVRVQLSTYTVKEDFGAACQLHTAALTYFT